MRDASFRRRPLTTVNVASAAASTRTQTLALHIPQRFYQYVNLSSIWLVSFANRGRERACCTTVR